ncbi:MAG: hypothetical protein LC799_07720, partial [Actinobacteria bacterium]|nr:hypothetical protein [Actinomycetota bacterium]
ANTLRTRFEQRGLSEDLDEAEEAIRAAMHDALANDWKDVRDQSVLGGLLIHRYLRSGRADVIEEAITLLESAAASIDIRNDEFPNVCGSLE